jgi:hypothetical protein
MIHTFRVLRTAEKRTAGISDRKGMTLKRIPTTIVDEAPNPNNSSLADVGMVKSVPLSFDGT